MMLPPSVTGEQTTRFYSSSGSVVDVEDARTYVALRNYYVLGNAQCSVRDVLGAHEEMERRNDPLPQAYVSEVSAKLGVRMRSELDLRQILQFQVPGESVVVRYSPPKRNEVIVRDPSVFVELFSKLSGSAGTWMMKCLVPSAGDTFYTAGTAYVYRPIPNKSSPPSQRARDIAKRLMPREGERLDEERMAEKLDELLDDLDRRTRT